MPSVVRSNDILGKMEVRHILKARSNGYVCAAKVLCRTALEIVCSS